MRKTKQKIKKNFNKQKKKFDPNYKKKNCI